MLESLFWICAVLTGYVYAGYPILLTAISFLRPKPVFKKTLTPFVSIVIAAHNEDAVIRNKLDNCAALDYPPDKYEVLVASDGSRDQTNAIVRDYDNAHVRLLDFPDRVGKMGTLNKAIQEAKGEIIVFTDASEHIESQAVKLLMENFADPQVGSASGELIFTRELGQTGLADGIGLYWTIEKFMRDKESRIDSMLGATGAFYAIRKSLVPDLPPQTILDDMAIPFGAILKGYRAIFDSAAKVYEKISETFDEEFSRKIRTLAGNFQLLIIYPKLVSPFHNRVFWQLMSHKIGRLVVPYCLIGMFIASWALPETLYQILFYLQIIFYGLGIIGYFSERKGIKLKPCSVAYAFLTLNAAALLCPWYLMQSGGSGIWKQSK